MSDLEGPHLNIGMVAMAKYVRYLFNLQHNTGRTVIEQRMHLNAYKELATTTSRELDRLRHENAILHRGTLPPLDQDRELQVAYRRVSEVKHGWNYTRQ
jgi:hypothetical protein